MNPVVNGGGAAPTEIPSDIVWPDLPSKCTWHLATKDKTPHSVDPRYKNENAIYLPT